MKPKYQHKGIRKHLQLVDNYDYCFGDFERRGIQVPSEQAAAICKACRNHSCQRAGRGFNSWVQRMAEQPEYLLNNPQFSDLSLEDHKQIFSIDFESLKQKVEKIVINGSSPSQGWESAVVKPDSVESIPLRKPKGFVEDAEPTPSEGPIERGKSTPASAPPPKKPSEPIRNTPMPSGGMMVGGGTSEPPSTERPSTPHDPWTDADQIVDTGAKITLK